MKNKTRLPLFSIITCTYNSEKFIGKNIISVLNQKFNSYEYIIIDGNSSDNTIKVAKELLKKAGKTAKIKKYPPKGISNAFNQGIGEATGRYLYFLNSDDHFSDEYVLRNTALFLEKEDADWIYGKIKVLDEAGNSIGVFPDKKIFQTANTYLLKFFNFVPHQAVFMKKEVFNKYGRFDEDLKVNMDYEYWLRIANATEWRFFDRIIANYSIRPEAASSGRSNRNGNIRSLEKIQARYLNKGELLAAKLINFLVDKYNKTYR